MAWLNASWTYRLKLTSDNTKVPSNQTDIPLAIDLSEIGGAHGFWGNVKSAGADIRITESDGETEVPIEVYNVDTGAETGIVYFKADITGASDTDYYLYYGNSGASAYGEGDTYGQHNVWDSNYLGVYHLGDSTAEDVKDSTSNSVDEGAGSSSATSVAAKVGDGFDFNGSSNNITFESGVTTLCPSGALQFELWFNADAKGSDVLFSTRLDSTNKGYGLWFWNSNLRPSIGIGGSGNVWTNVTYPMSSISTNTWYKVVVKWDGSTTKMFVDDDEKDSYSSSGTISYSGSQMNIGTRASGDDFDGTLDEFWISDTARSDNWNTVIYNWQNDQSAFWTIGAEETDTGGGATFIPKVQII
jgi:hypothetical protein